MTGRSPDPEPAPLSRDQAKWRWRVLVATYFAYAGFYLTRKVFTLCKPQLASEFHVGIDRIAHIWTVYLIAYAGGQVLNSFIGRRWGPRVLLLGGFGASIAINLVFGLTDSYWTFLGFMFFNGIAQAAGWPGCVGGVSQWLRKKERGTVMGFWSTNYLVGNILVKSIGGLLLAQYGAAHGWRYAYFACTAAAFAIWWLVFLWQRDRPEDLGLAPIVGGEGDAGQIVAASTAERVGLREYSRIALNPVILLLGASYFGIKFLRYSLDSWAPTFLQYQGMSASSGAFWSLWFDYAGLPGAILAGWLLDRWFRGRWPMLVTLMCVGMALAYTGVSMLGTSPHALALWYGAVGLMLYGPDTLLCGAVAVEVAGEVNAVAVAGIVNGIGSFGPILQEEVIGHVMRGADHRASMAAVNLLTLRMSLMVVAMMLALTAYVRWSRRRASLRVEAAAE